MGEWRTPWDAVVGAETSVGIEDLPAWAYAKIEALPFGGCRNPDEAQPVSTALAV